VLTQVEPLGVHFQAVTRNQTRAHLGELPFAKLRKVIKEPFRKDQLQHGVAEELEPLIVEMVPLRFVPERRMGQRLRQQKRISEFILQALFKRIHQALY
jgi:hypothetical protein